jgi:GNAT superfamily N-acetyltransferase
VQYTLLGWSGDGPTLRLDYRRFAYAGKFVTGGTGVAAAWDADDPVVGRVPRGRLPSPPVVDDGREGAGRTDGHDGHGGGRDVDGYADVVAAASFSPDRTAPDALRIRYVTVRDDRRGEGIGPRLLRFVVAAATDRGFDRVVIAVNNPFAYEAAARAGFGWTGAETGLAELVCATATPGGDRVDADAYRAGLDVFRDRFDDDPETSFLDGRSDPPPVVEPPAGATPAADEPAGFGASGFGAGGFGGSDGPDGDGSDHV